jgi:hypothetical protein
LDSGLDAVFVARGRFVRRRPDANATSYTNADSYAWTNSYADAESRYGM